MRKLKGYIPTTFLMAMLAFGTVAAHAEGIIVTRDGGLAEGIIVTKSLGEETPCEESKDLAGEIFDTVIGFVKTGIIVTRNVAPCGIIVT